MPTYITKEKKAYWSFGYHYGGMERAGVQFSYAVQCKQTEFRLYTRQANLLLPEEMYGLHIGIGIKKVFLQKETDANNISNIQHTNSGNFFY